MNALGGSRIAEVSGEAEHGDANRSVRGDRHGDTVAETSRIAKAQRRREQVHVARLENQWLIEAHEDVVAAVARIVGERGAGDGLQAVDGRRLDRHAVLAAEVGQDHLGDLGVQHAVVADEDAQLAIEVLRDPRGDDMLRFLVAVRAGNRRRCVAADE